jgi:hypothetical protein
MVSDTIHNFGDAAIERIGAILTQSLQAKNEKKISSISASKSPVKLKSRVLHSSSSAQSISFSESSMMRLTFQLWF